RRRAGFHHRHGVGAAAGAVHRARAALPQGGRDRAGHRAALGPDVPRRARPRLTARARACTSGVSRRAPVPGSARQTPPTTPAHITRAPRGADGSLTAPLGGQPRRSRVAGSSRLTAPARAGGCVPERWSVMASGGQRPATARTSTNGGWRPLIPAICGCSTPQAAAASPHGAVNGRGDRLERGRGDRGVDPHTPDDLPAHFALHIGGSGGVPAFG